MTAFLAAVGTAVALVLVVEAAVRVREERLWRRDQERANAELVARRRERQQAAMAADGIPGRAAVSVVELEAIWRLPCAPDREVSR